MLDESPALFLDEIQDWVALSHDIVVSLDTDGGWGSYGGGGVVTQ